VHSLNRSQTLSQLSHSRTSVKRVHLVESSLALRAVQEKKLQAWGGNGKSGLELHWHHSVEDIPTTDGVYTMLVAHEFFDALPFHLIEVRLRHLHRCQTHTLIEKSSRLERGLDYLCSRSNCKDYPETFRRRFLPRSIAIYISDAFPPSTRDGALISVDITWWLFSAVFIPPYRRSDRSFCNILPNCTQAWHAYLPGRRWQCVNSRLWNRSCRRELLPCTCPFRKRYRHSLIRPTHARV
jgi:hypothetical protein